ncbi:MAG TPA: ATP-dependent protease ATPase subunit HslU [Fimbriimonas sp.]|nr:ATP-dependent protease ATPase subunit HslU [Fimbriimonas sp.]
MSSLPIEDLTPRQIVSELDKYIVGQTAAKRAVAVALRNRYRRQQLPEKERDDVQPKNILMMGPTGVGKTEIARRLAQLARAPFVKVEATKFTEVGYVGRDVESMIRDLVATAVRLVEKERAEAVQIEAERFAVDRIVDLLHAEINATTYYPDEEGIIDWDKRSADEQAQKDVIRAELLAGQHEDAFVEFDVEEPSNPFLQVFTPGGMEEMGFDMNQLTNPFGNKRVMRKATVAEARALLIEEEAAKLIDRHSVHREAVTRAEQTGIIFIDEIDKVAGKSGSTGPDVSREGVQRDLLPIIEGSTVQTKFGPVRTEHILFVAAGAFHMSKPSDLIPELQGRLPIRVELESLSGQDFRRILTEPKNALIGQYQSLLRVEGVEVTFTPDAIDEIARLAEQVNTTSHNIGARRLQTMLELLLQDLLFDAPEDAPPSVQLTGKEVRAKLEDFVANLERANLMV